MFASSWWCSLLHYWCRLSFGCFRDLTIFIAGPDFSSNSGCRRRFLLSLFFIVSMLIWEVPLVLPPSWILLLSPMLLAFSLAAICSCRRLTQLFLSDAVLVCWCFYPVYHVLAMETTRCGPLLVQYQRRSIPTAYMLCWGSRYYFYLSYLNSRRVVVDVVSPLTGFGGWPVHVSSQLLTVRLLTVRLPFRFLEPAVLWEVLASPSCMRSCWFLVGGCSVSYFGWRCEFGACQLSAAFSTELRLGFAPPHLRACAVLFLVSVKIPRLF